MEKQVIAEKNKVHLRVWGDYACFSRPEMKVERVSYDVMTPSAARGILEAIYWKPQIRWVIDKIRVLRPIKFVNIRRNEVADRVVKPQKSYLSGEENLPIGFYIEDSRQLRAATLLQNVEYVIEAHFIILSGVDSPKKHFEMFKRRAKKGQYFQQPYFGCREFIAHFEWCETTPELEYKELMGTRDLGYMLHDLLFIQDTNGKIVESNKGKKVRAEPRFFRAEMIDGVINIPPLDSPETTA